MKSFSRSRLLSLLSSVDQAALKQDSNGFVRPCGDLLLVRIRLLRELQEEVGTDSAWPIVSIRQKFSAGSLDDMMSSASAERSPRSFKYSKDGEYSCTLRPTLELDPRL